MKLLRSVPIFPLNSPTRWVFIERNLSRKQAVNSVDLVDEIFKGEPDVRDFPKSKLDDLRKEDKLKQKDWLESLEESCDKYLAQFFQAFFITYYPDRYGTGDHKEELRMRVQQGVLAWQHEKWSFPENIISDENPEQEAKKIIKSFVTQIANHYSTKGDEVDTVEGSSENQGALKRSASFKLLKGGEIDMNNYLGSTWKDSKHSNSNAFFKSLGYSFYPHLNDSSAVVLKCKNTAGKEQRRFLKSGIRQILPIIEGTKTIGFILIDGDGDTSINYANGARQALLRNSNDETVSFSKGNGEDKNFKLFGRGSVTEKPAAQETVWKGGDEGYVLKKHAEDEVSQVRKLVEAVLKGEKPEGGSEEDKADGGSEEDKADGGSEEDKADGGSEEDEQEGGSKEDKSDSGSEEDDSEQLPEDHPFVWLERVLRHSSISAETLVKAFEGSSTQVFNLGHGDSLTIRPNGAWSLATISSNEALNGDGIKALEELFSQHKINYELTKSFISAELGELNEISVILSNAYIQFSNPAAFVFKNKGKRVEVILSDKNANKDQILANVVNSISREKIKNLKGASAIAQAIKELFADEAKTAPSSGGGGSKEDKSGNESEEDDSEQLPKDHPFCWLERVVPTDSFSAGELAQAFEDNEEVEFDFGQGQVLKVKSDGSWIVNTEFLGQNSQDLEQSLLFIKNSYERVIDLINEADRFFAKSKILRKNLENSFFIFPNEGDSCFGYLILIDKNENYVSIPLVDRTLEFESLEGFLHHADDKSCETLVGAVAIANVIEDMPLSFINKWGLSRWMRNVFDNNKLKKKLDGSNAGASQGGGTETEDDGGSEPSPPEKNSSTGEYYGVFSAENSDKVAEVFAEGGEILLENGEQKLVVQPDGSWEIFNNDGSNSFSYGKDQKAFTEMIQKSQKKLSRLQEILQAAVISEVDKALIDNGVFWGQNNRFDWRFISNEDIYLVQLDDFCDSFETPSLDDAISAIVCFKNGEVLFPNGAYDFLESLKN